MARETVNIGCKLPRASYLRLVCRQWTANKRRQAFGAITAIVEGLEHHTLPVCIAGRHEHETILTGTLIRQHGTNGNPSLRVRGCSGMKILFEAKDEASAQLKVSKALKRLAIFAPSRTTNAQQH